MSTGRLYMIPCTIGEDNPLYSLPAATLEVIRNTSHFVVEHPKTARHFIKKCEHPAKISDLNIEEFNKKTDTSWIPEILAPLKEGKDMGVISEAGCPGVADPGSDLASYAHQIGAQVVPLIGPSSILLALMASGFNGQNFAFHGYLPKDESDLKRKLNSFEKHIRDYSQSQVFIETPYRTDSLITSLIKYATPDLKLSVSANINQADEKIVVKRISEWRKQKVNFGKTPAVFILYR